MKLCEEFFEICLKLDVSGIHLFGLWLSLDDCRLFRQGFKQVNPFKNSLVNLVECPPVGVGSFPFFLVSLDFQGI